jgi:hypothetical protein
VLVTARKQKYLGLKINAFWDDTFTDVSEKRTAHFQRIFMHGHFAQRQVSVL